MTDDGIDFTGHVCRVAADVEVCFLQKKFVDFIGVLLQAVLYVNLLRSFTGKSSDEFEAVAKVCFVLLLEKDRQHDVVIWKMGQFAYLPLGLVEEIFIGVSATKE